MIKLIWEIVVWDKFKVNVYVFVELVIVDCIEMCKMYILDGLGLSWVMIGFDFWCCEGGICIF